MRGKLGGPYPLSFCAGTVPEPFWNHSGTVLKPFWNRSGTVPESPAFPERIPNRSGTVPERR